MIFLLAIKVLTDVQVAVAFSVGSQAVGGPLILWCFVAYRSTKLGYASGIVW